MKILFCVRHNFYSSPGGAQIQILKTIDGLQKMGCECDLVTNTNQCKFPIESYDLVNLTDLTWIYELKQYVDFFRKFHVPIVLTTIYWPFDDYVENASPWFQRLLFHVVGLDGTERIKAFYKYLRQHDKVFLQGVLHGYIHTQKEIALSVDWMLPNSHMEQQALNHRLGTCLSNYSVVNNAVDLTTFQKVKADCVIERDENLLLFVGRIDPRKNQLNLLKAIYDLPYKVCFIGQAGPNSQYYYKTLMELGKKRGNTEFIMQIPQEKVFEYMLKAKAHALTSWIETPGLVSLEAYYAGCNLVVSDKGSVREYFGDNANYCAPDDLASIRAAVISAMTQSYDGKMKKKIEEEYSWNFAAKQTFDAYLKLLGKQK